MKKFFYIIILSILILSTSACAMSQNLDPESASLSNSLSTTDSRSIEVVGEATMSTAPDIAIITLGVITEESTPLATENKNSEIMGVLFEELKTLGIADSDIQTYNFYMYQHHNFDENGHPVDFYYHASNTMRVTVRDINMLNDVINNALENGANTIDSISFDLSDTSIIYENLLEKAIMNGMSRAEVMAKSVGASLGDVQQVSSSLYGNGFNMNYDAFSTDMYPNVGLGGGNIPITSGDFTISVTVMMKIEME